MHRTIEKIKHPMRAKLSDSVQDLAVADPTHLTTAEYAGSAGQAIIGEISMYIKGPEGDAVLRTLFRTQAEMVADVVGKLLISDEIKEACRLAGSEIVLGSYQRICQKVAEAWERLPTSLALSLLSASAIFVVLFMLGLLLALWRFVLYGLD